ncbi:hypothetical protein AYI69_g6162, partial [Smittium culicis]
MATEKPFKRACPEHLYFRFFVYFKNLFNKLSEQAFNKYVSNVDKAPPGNNLAAIEPGSDAEHQEISDI